MVKIGPESNEYSVPKQPQSTAVEQKQEIKVWAAFQDSDGIVDTNDVEYTKDAQNSGAIANFLNNNVGKKWTNELVNKVNNMVTDFNNSKSERNGEDLSSDSFDDFRNQANSEFDSFREQVHRDFDDFKNNTKDDFEAFKKDSMAQQASIAEDSNANTGKSLKVHSPEHARKAGDTWAELNEDGSTTIHTRGKADVVVPAESTEVKQVAKTDQAAKTNQAEQSRKMENPQKLAKNGVYGKYEIISKGNGSYQVNNDAMVSVLDNKNAQKFMEGSEELYGTSKSKIKRLDNGKFEYRGIVAGTYNILKMIIINKSQQIALNTEIYKDLSRRQASGETLNEGEIQFMNDLSKSVEKYGFKLDKNGDIQ